MQHERILHVGAAIFSLSPRQAGDGPGRLETAASLLQRPYVICLSCCAAEKQPQMYGGKLYGKRYEVERMFRKLKGFRRVFNQFDRTDVVFIGFIMPSLIVTEIKQC